MVDGGAGGLQSNERTEMGRVEMEYMHYAGVSSELFSWLNGLSF